MAEVFKYQGFLDIILDTEMDLTTGTDPKIKYRKPDGTNGEWSGTVVETTKIKKTLANADIDQNGKWSFQPFIDFAGRHAFGDVVHQIFTNTLKQE